MTFLLHERLAADTLPVADLELCRVLLMDDARYPWVILVPRLPALRELHEVPQNAKQVLWTEIDAVCEALAAAVQPFKLNVAALGNQVPQLHIHVIARFETDAAWPGPVWGVGDPEPYRAGQRDALLQALRARL